MLRKESLRFILYSRCLMALSNLHFFGGGYHTCGLKGKRLAKPSINSIRNSVSVLRLKGSLDEDGAAFRRPVEGNSKAHAMAPLRQMLRERGALGDEISTNFANGLGKTRIYPPQWKREKIAVAVDVDEVLGSFISALNKFIADRYSSYHTVSEYYVYEFFRIWKCTRAEAEIRVHEFFRTLYFTSGVHPIPGAHSALSNLSAFCNLSVVTSRQHVIKDQTCDWIERHYPNLFKEIHFGNHFALEGKSTPKSEMCRSIGAQVLIDDNPRYAVECAKAGIRVLLFDYHNSYPWCKDESVNSYSLVTKVHNWNEVEQLLNSWAVV